MNGRADDRRPTTVIVADDDERVREMLVGLLDDLGYRVAAAFPEAPAAIAACVDDPPDVVLLDYRMPGMSGTEATTRLRELVPALPVVLLSAYDDAGVQEAARAAGASAFLVKGCTAQEISDAIDEAVGGRA
jgi:CheY-like chemotaxis protein